MWMSVQLSSTWLSAHTLFMQLLPDMTVQKVSAEFVHCKISYYHNLHTDGLVNYVEAQFT